MADIYLTKIERKTIFTRSLIYVLVLFLVADLTVTGPFYFNFIPWLFIFSCMISLREVDKVLTGLIGTFTVFVASLVTNGMGGMTILLTGNALLQLVLGMAMSKGIHQFILEHRLVKYIRPRAKMLLIGIMIGILVVSYAALSFVHGDLISYLNSKKSLDKYVANTYGCEYELKTAIYNRKYIGKYAYIVNIDGVEVQFLPSLSETFKDINQETRLNALNKEIKENTISAIQNVVEDREYLTSSMISYKYGYNKVGIVPDALVLNITINEKETSELYTEISEVLNELLETNYEATEIVVTINNVSLYISKDNFELITPEYIEGGFNIEDLDE